ncbi:hypothetical protein OXPF_26770 [Oxobacter pfennigii]|uniref:SHOCT domain-containing protein n=1 Tax=Oxobacter pfennigii TaxID=36849 RepID=A0A0P8WZB0_9CLOT|nr:hypothetical protein [Oxobacter pfennigii]KPU43817.1 hypothetical protein OXPF_26770 [Oxobacter pfennigii]
MDDKLVNYGEKLKELCTIITGIFDDLKSKGKISEEEYIKHTELKKKFLDEDVK